MMLFLERESHNHKENEMEGKSYPARYSLLSFIEKNIVALSGFTGKGSMTVETSIVLPVFLFVMLSIFQFASIQIASSALLAGMQETAKDMAVYAYVQDIGINTGDSLAGDLIVGGLSAAYAKGKIEGLAGNAISDGKFSLLQSSFLTDEMIDIVGSYQKNHTLTIFPVQKVKAVLRTRVRAWTGREGRPHKNEASVEDAEEEADEEKVYVAETGTVYHKDPNCSHIRLSIISVSKDSVPKRRNENGAKYYPCEKCGGACGDSVYISPQGNRYHSSLECSGVKRTVNECKLSEANGMRACSRCGGA